MSKKAIVVVSFGSSFEDARVNCIEPVENLIATTYPDYEVRRAFTSRFIVGKLKKEQNLYIDNEVQATQKLIDEGFEKIYIQPLHTMPGFEYDKIKRQFDKIKDNTDVKILLGEPLIYRLEDYDFMIEGLKNSLMKLEDFDVDHWLLMGHGTEHFSNAVYGALQLKFDIEGHPFDIATVEGFPELDDIMDRLKSKNIKKLGVAPFMLVAGDHARNDMAGDEEDSWVNVLKDNGFDVYPCLRGMGSFEAFRELFLRKTAALVERKR